jgi:hypothetical protein
MRRFAKPLYGLTPVPRVRIPPSPPRSLERRETRLQSRKIARNGHNFASLADKPDWRKCATFAPEPTLGPFSLKSPLHSPVSKTPSGECNAITKRCCGEGDLTSWKWKILPFHPPSWAATLNGDTIGKGVRSNRTVWVVTSTVGVVGPGWIRTNLMCYPHPGPVVWTFLT